MNANNQPRFELGVRPEYSADDRISLRLGYYHSHWPGNQGIALTNVKQAVTHVGFDFKLSPSHTMNLDLRLIDMRDFVDSTSYNANPLFVRSVIRLQQSRLYTLLANGSDGRTACSSRGLRGSRPAPRASRGYGSGS